MVERLITARVQIQMSGDWATECSSRDAPEAGLRTVTVTTDRIVTMCSAAEHVAQRARVWAEAAAKSRQIRLPARAHGPALVGVAISVISVDHESDSMVAVSADDAPAGYVMVRVGPLSIMCLDRVSVARMAETWADAAALAELLWRPGPRQYRRLMDR